MPRKIKASGGLEMKPYYGKAPNKKKRFGKNKAGLKTQPMGFSTVNLRPGAPNPGFAISGI